MDGLEPKIAVIIVNYNVTFFLEQCLNSVAIAMKLMPAEVWVVDNNSVDGSVEMVQTKFPWVKLIANKDNKGFSKANNQAMSLSHCPYQLLLNPDTVIEETTLKKVVDYMDANPEVGGLGVRMLDGKGAFLPESKRGLPTPEVAFYKIIGLARLFPKSHRFGKYHLGYLSEFETNEVEILSGAFMLMRKEALDKVGLLDEDFFMYGEDVDLSYRIIKGGYKNVYFPETRIIHYKGESTKKSSVNYVFVFYRAMQIFATKHFSQKNAQLLSLLINCAIYFRAALAIGSRFIKRLVLPAIDLVYIITGLFAMTHYWHSAQIEFPRELLLLLIPAYAITWFLSVGIMGGYDKPIQIKKFFRAIVLGTGFILVCYALFPKDWQFSRLFILIGASWTFVYYLLSRLFLHFSVGKRFTINGKHSGHFAIVGSISEFERVALLLRQTQLKIETVLHVSVEDKKEVSAIGTVSQLDQIVTIHRIDEVIFCAKDTTAKDIIHWMTRIQHPNIDFKIAQPDTSFLIGSNSIETAGDLYILNINAIDQQSKKRQKRALDILISCFIVFISPVLCWFYKDKKQFFGNLFSIMGGQISFVSYSASTNVIHNDLPKLKRGVFTPSDRFSQVDDSLKVKLDLLYAREYGIMQDFHIILRSWKKLDRSLI